MSSSTPSDDDIIAFARDKLKIVCLGDNTILAIARPVLENPANRQIALANPLAGTPVDRMIKALIEAEEGCNTKRRLTIYPTGPSIVDKIRGIGVAKNINELLGIPPPVPPSAYGGSAGTSIVGASITQPTGAGPGIVTVARGLGRPAGVAFTPAEPLPTLLPPMVPAPVLPPVPVPPPVDVPPPPLTLPTGDTGAGTSPDPIETAIANKVTGRFGERVRDVGGAEITEAQIREALRSSVARISDRDVAAASIEMITPESLASFIRPSDPPPAPATGAIFGRKALAAAASDVAARAKGALSALTTRGGGTSPKPGPFGGDPGAHAPTRTSTPDPSASPTLSSGGDDPLTLTVPPTGSPTPEPPTEPPVPTLETSGGGLTSSSTIPAQLSASNFDTLPEDIINLRNTRLATIAKSKESEIEGSLKNVLKSALEETRSAVSDKEDAILTSLIETANISKNPTSGIRYIVVPVNSTEAFGYTSREKFNEAVGLPSGSKAPIEIGKIRHGRGRTPVQTVINIADSIVKSGGSAEGIGRFQNATVYSAVGLQEAQLSSDQADRLATPV